MPDHSAALSGQVLRNVLDPLGQPMLAPLKLQEPTAHVSVRAHETGEQVRPGEQVYPAPPPPPSPAQCCSTTTLPFETSQNCRTSLALQNKESVSSERRASGACVAAQTSGEAASVAGKPMPNAHMWPAVQRFAMKQSYWW